VILVFVEHQGGAVDRPSLGAVALARDVADRIGQPLAAVAFGPEAEDALTALGPAGVDLGWAVQHRSLDTYAPAAWARSIGQLAADTGADVILAPGSQRGNEVMAHAGAQLGQPMAANCVAVGSVDPFVVTRQRWGGSLLEEALLDAEIRLLTVAEGVRPAGSDTATAVAAARSLRVQAFGPAVRERDLRVSLARHALRETTGVPLAGARIVVGGGRGVGSAADFAPLDELAGLLGGAVGVSRVVTGAGWRPHAEQIGQTGTRIAPDVYIACGISGAIQHIVGCSGARTIIAINTDPDAPILSRASFAVIGDLHTIVPAICAEIRRTRGA